MEKIKSAGSKTVYESVSTPSKKGQENDQDRKE
jgi:hypothetical protein